MSKELNTPGWLDDVMPPGHAGLNVGEDVYTRSEVKSIILTALLRYESERPSQRPWARIDRNEFDSDRDYVAFLDWVEEQSKNHKGSKNLLFYRLLFDAYEGHKSDAPGSETGGKP